jgi:hypothetical protein
LFPVRSKDTQAESRWEEITVRRNTVGFIVMLTIGILVVPLATVAQQSKSWRARGGTSRA